MFFYAVVVQSFKEIRSISIYSRYGFLHYSQCMVRQASGLPELTMYIQKNFIHHEMVADINKNTCCGMRYLSNCCSLHGTVVEILSVS